MTKKSLAQTVKIFSDDIRMQFRIEKCATIKLQRGKVKHTEGIVPKELSYHMHKWYVKLRKMATSISMC